MNDIAFPRVATILKENGIVSSIAQMQAPPSQFAQKGKSAETAHFFHEVVGPDVRTGMVRLADGSFHWPDGSVNHTDASRQALAKAMASSNALKAGRAA